MARLLFYAVAGGSVWLALQAHPAAGLAVMLGFVVVHGVFLDRTE